MLTSVYLINHMHTRVLKDNTPISLLLQTHEVFSLPLRVFGYICFIHELGLQVQKLNIRAMKRVFLGYSLRNIINVLFPLWASDMFPKMLRFFEEHTYFSENFSLGGNCGTCYEEYSQ